MQNNPLCITHNEPIQFYDTIVKDLKASWLCRFCILQKMSNIRPINNFENCQITFEVQQYCQNTIKILYQLIESMNSYQFSIQTILHNLSKQILQYIEMMENFQLELSINLSAEEQQNRIYDKNQEIVTLINEQLENLEEQSKTNQLFQQLQQLNNQVEKQEVINYKNLEYKVLEQFSNIEVENCSVIVFNQDASLIIYGCQNNIEICQFKNGCISNIQQELKGHTLEVFCLLYMKKTNQISAGYDSTIIIWKKNLENQWVLGQKLNDHTKYINCIEMNEMEDLLISGSNDKNIKFYQIQNNQWICTQTLLPYFEICGLSFDNQAQRLIACGYPFSGVWIIESNSCKEWKITQTIQTGYIGLRLCVFDSNTFAFQPNSTDFLQIFEFDNDQKEFKKAFDVKILGSQGSYTIFPCQYIKSKQILIVKSNKCVNILRRQKNKQFITQQSIEYIDMFQFGRATDDGEYLLVWDKQTKKIQVRKLEYEN